VYVKGPGTLSFTRQGHEALIPGERVVDPSRMLAFWFDVDQPWKWSDGAPIDDDDRWRLLRELPEAARQSDVVLYMDAELKPAIEKVIGALPDVRLGRWTRPLERDPRSRDIRER